MALADPSLEIAERLEREAASERVSYYLQRVNGVAPGQGPLRIVDVGCGNGYAVSEWRKSGALAFGVDISTYRFSRWVTEHSEVRPFVVADASRLPFRSGAVEHVVSSGMIEHVGVDESRPPYRIVPRPEKNEIRGRVIGELVRIVKPEGSVLLDFPNGSFPIDFWHGDDVGAFRRHPVPDALLPSFADVAGWSDKAHARATLLPLGRRLRFKQISSRWWGRALRLPAFVFVRALDLLQHVFGSELVAPAYPFLVVRISPER